MSEEQSAERIADYFATISQEFPPLDYESLPAHVRRKIENENLPPTVDEFEVYNAIKSTRTGPVLLMANSEETEEYATENQMKLNQIDVI